MLVLKFKFRAIVSGLDNPEKAIVDARHSNKTTIKCVPARWTDQNTAAKWVERLILPSSVCHQGDCSYLAVWCCRPASEWVWRGVRVDSSLTPVEPNWQQGKQGATEPLIPLRRVFTQEHTAAWLNHWLVITASEQNTGKLKTFSFRRTQEQTGFYNPSLEHVWAYRKHARVISTVC